MSENLKEIIRLIGLYRDNYKNLSLDQLVNMRDRLAAYCFSFAEEVADIKTGYNETVFVRRVEVMRTKQNILKARGKLSDGKLKDEADLEHIEELKAELERESASYKADLLLRQANRVIDAIEQRVSYKKLEYSMTQRH